MIEIRKLQKSRTGFYINIPKKLATILNIKGDEMVKIVHDKENNKLVIEFVEVL